MEILAIEAKLAASEVQIKQLTRLSEHYTKVRYPDYAQKDYNTKSKSEPIFNNLSALYSWVLDQLENH